jgi:hypothetical protein
LIWMISSLKCPPGKRLRSRGMNQTSPNKATQKESMPHGVSHRSNTTGGPSRASTARASKLLSIHRFKKPPGPKLGPQESQGSASALRH